METAYISTPLGTAKLEGDLDGIAAITVSDKTPIGVEKVPDSLKPAAEQLEEYFLGKRTEFDLKLNPQGTDFQKKVWEALLDIPFGKTVSYLDLSKTLGDVKAIRR